MKSLTLVTGILLLLTTQAEAGCRVFKASADAVGLSDPLFLALKREENCPENVFELKEVLAKDGLSTKPALVANRGRHNPKFGSFSFFEMVTGDSTVLGKAVDSGDFFFGHFTGAGAGIVELDQSPDNGKLMIELIVWDFEKKLFNFYELIGHGNGATWFYRGDSTDAFNDNKKLHLQLNPETPEFGGAMRCSGCHTSGGPIMKELEAPHNDWWTESRPLPMAPNQPSSVVTALLKATVDTSEFAASVKKGIGKLESSDKFQTFKKSLSGREILRPLFCTQEINLVSASFPLEDSSEKLEVPASFWVGDYFGAGKSVLISKAAYLAEVRTRKYRFPETARADADHAWLAPVKSHSDYLQIETLIALEIISRDLAERVLAIDLSNPLFSKERCALLKKVPATLVPGWEKVLINTLPGVTGNPKLEAEKLLAMIQEKIGTSAGLGTEMNRLENNRAAVFVSEISKNPRGQILEPGFRVIFPKRGP